MAGPGGPRGGRPGWARRWSFPLSRCHTGAVQEPRVLLPATEATQFPNWWSGGWNGTPGACTRPVRCLLSSRSSGCTGSIQPGNYLAESMRWRQGVISCFICKVQAQSPYMWKEFCFPHECALRGSGWRAGWCAGWCSVEMADCYTPVAGEHRLISLTRREDAAGSLSLGRRFHGRSLCRYATSSAAAPGLLHYVTRRQTATVMRWSGSVAGCAARADMPGHGSWRVCLTQSVAG